MIHMIGNAHIDPVWLWRWQEGYQEIKATFQSALDRMNETDEFVFTCACADYYRWVEENAPDMFENIRRRVAEGRWKIVGGMWIQPDCNMPSGESFARQLLYSQRYFKEKFGVIAKTGYNVDSFGHSAMLPALLSGAGIENYVFLRPGVHENARLPYPLFKWTTPDGSSVNAFRILDAYNSSRIPPMKKIENALEMEDKMGYPIMAFYGVGNHGGGPTVQNIVSIREYQKNGERGGEVIFSDPDTYFEEVKKLGIQLPEWKGELQHHASGCYSATSLIKSLNRKTENALLRCEFFAAMADVLTDHKMKPLDRAWQNLMFNQFHDIMCGCSIREAYEDAHKQLYESMSFAEYEENAALQKISWRVDTVAGIPGRIRSKESNGALWELNGLGTPLIVFNPHPFEVEAPVELYSAFAHITDENDVEVPTQIIRASRTNGANKWGGLFTARVPAMGYRLYWMYLAEKGEPSSSRTRPWVTDVDNDPAAIAASGLKVTETSIENKHIVAKFDPETGALVSLVRKASGREALKGPAMPRLMDIEHVDTWAHKVDVFDKAKESFQNAKFRVIEEGPVRARLRVTTTAVNSTLVQDYFLYANADQLEVKVMLDMHEKFRMLKLCFPVAASHPRSRAEISYGMIERVMDGCEETGHRWMEVGGAEGGIAILNDGKYSFSAEKNELRLTVANTSIYADHYGQQHRDELVYHADMGMQEFKYAIVPHDGDWSEADLAHRGEVFNRPLPNIAETYHEGDLPAVYSGLSVERANISVGALKRAEDDNGYILRVVETMGKATETVVDAPMFGRRIELSFAPMEIKTILVPDDASAPVKEVMITEW